MKRRALILGNPGEYGAANYCSGVEKDLENYKGFLESPLGGSWYSNEITVLKRPSAQDARAAIQRLTDADYSFAVFTGHGCTDGKTANLRLELRAGQELSGYELRQGASRHTAIYDCCRVIAPSTVKEERVMKAVMARADADPGETRRYFEAAIERCPRGLIVSFACSTGETASDDANSGGYYSSSLMLAAEEWSRGRFDTATSYYPFSVISAHLVAESKVKARSGNRQNPNIEKPRSEPYFPFAIIA